MDLYIMRHGDARDPSIVVLDDDARELTATGRDEVALMARLLAQLGVTPTLALTSPLIRARQTGELVADITGAPAPVTCPHLAPGGSVAGILQDIASHGRPKAVLLTGHMPDVSRILATLCWAMPDADTHFRTAEIACVRLPDDAPFPGSGDLRWLLAPKQAQRLLAIGETARKQEGAGE